MNVSALGFIQLFNHNLYKNHMKIFNNTQDRNHTQDMNFIIRKKAHDTYKEVDLEWIQMDSRK
jgi:hypothetical protein